MSEWSTENCQNYDDSVKHIINHVTMSSTLALRMRMWKECVFGVISILRFTKTSLLVSSFVFHAVCVSFCVESRSKTVEFTVVLKLVWGFFFFFTWVRSLRLIPLTH